MPSAAALRDRMVALMNPDATALPIVAALTDWNGRHDAGSSGALAYELMIYHLLHHLHADRDIDVYLASWDVLALLRRDLEALPRSRLGPAAADAAKAAQTDFARHGTWGAVHRLRLEHPFSRVPLIGHRYKFTDDPVAGGNETLMKTAHGVSRDVHRVNLGAVARHVSDLADPDANDFCLLGGQDGWLGSETFDDQYALWRDGRYIRVPLSAAAVAMSFPRVVSLRPAGASAGAENRPLENAHA
jgi:penicillin amidase